MSNKWKAQRDAKRKARFARDYSSRQTLPSDSVERIERAANLRGGLWWADEGVRRGKNENPSLDEVTVVTAGGPRRFERDPHGKTKRRGPLFHKPADYKLKGKLS